MISRTELEGWQFPPPFGSSVVEVIEVVTGLLVVVGVVENFDAVEELGNVVLMEVTASVNSGDDVD